MTGDLEGILEVGSVAASALAEHGKPIGICANCRQPLIGAYCAVCGQPTDIHRRTVRGLLQDFFVDIVNFDSRILRTARALLLQPGELPAAFREGRTQPYVPAIRFYLFVSLIFFVLLGVSNIAILQLQVTAAPAKVIWDASGKPFIANPAYDKADNDPEVRKYTPPLIPISRKKATRPGGVFNYSTQSHFFSRIGAYRSNLSKPALARLLEPDSVSGPDKASADWLQTNIYGALNRLAADPAALNEPLTAWLPRVLFLLLPLYALLIALFHIRRRKEFFLVDHLVFSLSIHTFTFVALIAAVGLAQLVSGEWAMALLFAALSLYIFLAMKHFYNQGWIVTTIKFIVISGIYTVFFLAPALVGVLALSVFGGSFG